jgi:hypothetical protein
MTALTEVELRAIINSLMDGEPDAIPEALRLLAREQMRKRRDRIVRNNQRYAQALAQMTDKQALEASKLEGNGYKVNQVFWHKDDPQGNVALMMVKESVYDGQGQAKDRRRVLERDVRQHVRKEDQHS